MEDAIEAALEADARVVGYDAEDLTVHCSCPHCDAESDDPETAEDDGWRKEESEWVCPECKDYSTTPDGDIICASHGRDGTTDADTCPDCLAAIEWGVITTARYPGGRTHQDGRCQCAGREWRTEERGRAWTVPTYRDPEPWEEEA